MTPPKIQVKETKRMQEDFEGQLEDIISLLKSYLRDGWEGIEVENVGYDGAVEYYLYKYRLETDQEYKVRMVEKEKQKEREQRAKEKRRLQYEKLKEEFDND